MTRFFRSTVLMVGFLLFGTSTHGFGAGLTDLTFATDGGPLKLSELRGKVVYLDFWASWCIPCRQSFPWMGELQRRYAEQGLKVVAVSVDRDVAEARRFIERFPAGFTVAYDPAGAAAATLALKGMPSSFIIDRDGKLVGAHVGFRESGMTRLEDELRVLLAR